MADQQFLSLAQGFKVPEGFVSFLTSSDLADSDSVALMAATEQGIEDGILKPAKAAGIDLSNIAHQIAVKKLWLACRARLSKSSETPSANSETSRDKIPTEVHNDLQGRWRELHGFVLPDSWLLTSQCQVKIWNDSTLQSPRVTILLMEQMRLLSNMGKSSLPVMSAVPGRAIELQECIVDSVTDNMEVYVRARAWLMTTALVNIRQPTWFGIQTAIFASDKIMTKCLAVQNGINATPQHLSAAWAQTIHHWSEQVRISGQALGSFVQQTGSWEHFWTWSPTRGGQVQEGALGKGNHDDLENMPKEVRNELYRLRKLAREHQSNVDKQRNEERRRTEGGKAMKSGGKGSKSSRGKDRSRSRGRAFTYRPRDRK